MKNPAHYFYTLRNVRVGATVTDLQDRREEQLAQGGQMVSIIEYTAKKRARNSYPHKIVSPPGASRCCLARMNRIGQMQAEGNKKFYYKRCSRCGFTVREFMSAIDIDRILSLGVSDWNQTDSWLDRIQHEADAEKAA